MAIINLFAPGKAAAVASDSLAMSEPAQGLAQEAVLLTVLNRSHSKSPAQLVLFKRNSAAEGDADESVVAWKVIRCAPGQRVHVVVPLSQQVGVFAPAGDVTGAHAGLETARAGELFTVSAQAGAPQLRKAMANGEHGQGRVGANMLGVQSNMAAGVLDVVLYKDGRPLCLHPHLQPGATAMFEVLPYLHVASGVGLIEGAPVDADTVRAATRISLLGLKSADLVLGGGAVPAFQLANQRFS